MSFIFQAIPERYDLISELRGGKRVAWLASRYRREMNRGDVVYLWLGGDIESRGIYGWGTISSDSAVQDEEDTYRIAVTYQKRFPSFIAAHEIRSHPALAGLLILRMPIGTNFLLSPGEDAAIRRLIVKKLGKQWAPPITVSSDGGS